MPLCLLTFYFISGERDSNITRRSDLFHTSDISNSRTLDQTDHSSFSSNQSLISQSVFKQSDKSLTKKSTSNQSYNRSDVTKALIQQSAANQPVSNQSSASNERLSQLKSTKDSLNQSTQQHENRSVWQNQPLTRSEERLNQSVTRTEQSSQSQSGTELTQSEIRTITKHLSQSEIRSDERLQNSNVESKPTAGIFLFLFPSFTFSLFLSLFIHIQQLKNNLIFSHSVLYTHIYIIYMFLVI